MKDHGTLQIRSVVQKDRKACGLMLWGDSRGFWEAVYGDPLHEQTKRLMPTVSDRFEESVFFAKRALEQPRTEDFCNEVTWYLGAHLSAFISIRDAGRIDYESAGRPFEGSPLARELKLQLNEDPLSANKAYRDLRNLRIHFAVPLVVLSRKVLVFDIARQPVGAELIGEARWYFRPLAWEEVRCLKTPQLSELEVARFNRYLRDRPIIDVMGQMLLVVQQVITESARQLDA
jgi:hypothetical protein